MRGPPVQADADRPPEKVLPYVRCLAGKLKVPVEFIGVVDLTEMGAHISADEAPHIPTLVEDNGEARQELLTEGYERALCFMIIWMERSY